MNTGLEIDHDALMTIELFRNSDIAVSAWTGCLGQVPLQDPSAVIVEDETANQVTAVTAILTQEESTARSSSTSFSRKT